MTNAMGPPPSKNPNHPTESEIKSLDEPLSSSEAAAMTTIETAMPPPPPPPPPRCPDPDPPKSNMDVAEGQPKNNSTSSIVAEAVEKTQDSSTTDKTGKPASKQSQSLVVPYKIPPWSGPPCHKFSLEVLKDGSVIDQLDVYEKGAYMFGRVDLCDFVLEHQTISRFHTVIQFKRSGNAYLYDLGSTHGTFVNKNQVEKNIYVDLHVGDVIRFGQSSRLYIFQGPSELMPPETDLKIMRDVRIREKILDQEASLQRARLEASHSDGISWGMGEDAIEEIEDDGDEVTWQTYKGQLTEKQEKTRDKVMKRMEKISNMKKEISAIRAKDISQGGLTQGQQIQIARNEQRMTQILEELENLEETLNESIRESLGARTGKISHGKKKGAAEDEEEFSSDDDEFYDRTKNKTSRQKADDNQSVETADTLLDKRDAIMKEIEDNKELLLAEKNKMSSESSVEDDLGDTLDAYMSGLSSKLVLDKTVQLQKEQSTLQSELDRINYLLKIADPTGEAAKKRESGVQGPKQNTYEKPVTVGKNQPKLTTPENPMTVGKKQPHMEHRSSEPCKEEKGSIQDLAVDSDKLVSGCDTKELEHVVYTVSKPQWLGAVEDRVTDETQKLVAPLHKNEMDETHQFVDYKDRKKVLAGGHEAKATEESAIESAAPGLILRKPKQVGQTEGSGPKASQQLSSSSVGDELIAENAVALLLKHKRGYYAADNEGRYENEDESEGHHPTKDNKKPKRMLGPEKPSFLSSGPDYESWVPPEGQSGDGRTSLNDRYGY
ncbi:kanadaptin [Quillaja saponaria]|uniref:Kanadaptin n=1 Tax=Quillaja saponaria TaxID=32244 RepID=A0AAD7Q3M8_QUISA|nr:kanadaptin [Quillaja saponaria]